MENKERVTGEYKVSLAYEGLTMDELCSILKLIDSGRLYGMCGNSYFELRDLKVGKDYDVDYDGWKEPAGTYNILLEVQQCGNFSKAEWDKWAKNEIPKYYDELEELRKFITAETGIE